MRYALTLMILGLAEILIIFSIIVFLFIYDFFLTSLIVMIIFLITIIYHLFTKNYSKKIGSEKFESLSSLQRKVGEGLNNIKLIKIYSSYEYFLKIFDKYNEKYSSKSAQEELILNIPKAVIEMTFVMIIVFVLSSGEIEKNFFSKAGVYGLAFFRLMPSINRLATAFSIKDITSYTFKTLDKIIKSSNASNNSLIKLRNQSDEKSLEIDSINLKNITFSFNDRNILKDVNINIKKKDFFAIVGSSGSGKSTLVNLILGLIEPQKGEVIYNENYNIFEKKNLFKNKISYVPQSITIQEISVVENIAFGIEKNKIDYKKVNEIIKLTNLVSLIDNLSQGIDTVIKDNNYNFSGGELQRLAIARSLYFDSDLIIFDEATNALDRENESKIFQNIYDLFYKKKNSHNNYA